VPMPLIARPGVSIRRGADRHQTRIGWLHGLGAVSLDFTAIDFETANSYRGSPCSVGLVKVRDGQIVDEAGTLKTQVVLFDVCLVNL
jgi:DNA polymerase III epsilon subunit-like protein